MTGTTYLTDTTYTTMPSPVGELLLTAEGSALTGVHFAHRAPAPAPGWRADHGGRGALAEVVRQLGEYFEGARKDFDLDLAPKGTAFQCSVWEQLRAIPYGSTISYGELARRVDNPRASRAVGLANGRNPIAIVVPCHRVIGADGSLTGYGGGMEYKRVLLDLEAPSGSGMPGTDPGAAQLVHGDLAHRGGGE